MHTSQRSLLCYSTVPADTPAPGAPTKFGTCPLQQVQARDTQPFVLNVLRTIRLELVSRVQRVCWHLLAAGAHPLGFSARSCILTNQVSITQSRSTKALGVFTIDPALEHWMRG